MYSDHELKTQIKELSRKILEGYLEWENKQTASSLDAIYQEVAVRSFITKLTSSDTHTQRITEWIDKQTDESWDTIFREAATRVTPAPTDKNIFCTKCGKELPYSESIQSPSYGLVCPLCYSEIIEDMTSSFKSWQSTNLIK